MDFILLCVASFLAAYLVGTIPFGFLLARLGGYGDIRKIGSGNIGATNVLRTGNKFLAALTLLLDGMKGALAVLGLSAFAFPILWPGVPPQEAAHVFALFMGLGAVVGHMFPVWLGFQGGKGVATALGGLLVALPWAGIFACAVWLVVAGVMRISSLAALVALALVPVAVFLLSGFDPALVCSGISLLVGLRHKANVARLLKGEEPRIGGARVSSSRDSAMVSL